MPKYTYYDGDVFSDGKRMRRVLGVIAGHVVYSVGGDKNRRCKLAQMRKFERRSQLVARGAGRPE